MLSCPGEKKHFQSCWAVRGGKTYVRLYYAGTPRQINRVAYTIIHSELPNLKTCIGTFLPSLHYNLHIQMCSIWIGMWIKIKLNKQKIVIVLIFVPFSFHPLCQTFAFYIHFTSFLIFLKSKPVYFTAVSVHILSHKTSFFISLLSHIASCLISRPLTFTDFLIPHLQILC